MNYRVNDIYSCIQGEGCLTGTAMVLLRLHGCGVGCPFCDTKETWTTDPESAATTIPEALGANVRYTVSDATTIARYIRDRHPGPRWVLLTGGEPADQQLPELVHALHHHGYKVALETSGTARGFLGAPLDWICVSPKVKMPGGRSIDLEVLERADEIKMVIGRAADLDTLYQLLGVARLKAGVQICLQPMSQNSKATELCVNTAIARGWRLSLQIHKYIGAR